MAQSDPELDALDRATLTPIVRRALKRDAADLLMWRWSPLAYDVYLPGRTLVRFIGTATVDGGEVPWSIVLKRTRPPQDIDKASDEGWKREASAYQSGLLADIPGQLTAARALAVTEDDQGATWLWLEDVVDRFSGAWPLAQYSRAARHLGQFNGTYLGDRPLPTFPWLAPHWAEHQGEPAQIPKALSEIDTLTSNGQVRRYGGPFCQDTGEGHFKVETSPFSRRLADLCESSVACGVAAGAT